MTGDPATVAAAINTMAATGGNDFPEAYNRVFFEAYSDPALTTGPTGYDPDAEKFLVVLGDAPPHDPTQTVAPACGDRPPVDPGRDGVPGTPDDLQTEDTIAGLNANNITLLMIRYQDSIPLECYEQLAQHTGGDAVNGGEGANLSQQIVDFVIKESRQIESVELQVSPGCELNISFNPTPPYGPFTAPVDFSFQETIKAPADATPGPKTCVVSVVADGAVRATQTINVTVKDIIPATLTLEPENAVNEVDQQHCVTATVKNASGDTLPDKSVEFKTTGAVDTSRSATTDSNGQAKFCFDGPPFPGDVVIEAFADTDKDTVKDTGEPGDQATKQYVLPKSTEGCKVTDGGRITTDSGDKATFGGNANVSGSPKGNQTYQDHGPATPIKIKSTEITSVSCSSDGTQARIFGTATVNGQGSFVFRIDVKDNGEPGRSDTYQIRLAGGAYDSGEHNLEGGNIQIHK